LKLFASEAPRVITEAERRRTAGRLAGALYLVGALTLLPSTLLLEPQPDLEVYLLTVIATASGCASLAAPWDRLPRAALHAPGILASIQVGLVIALLGEESRIYAAMYIFVGVWAAYAFTDRREIAAHVAFAFLAGAVAFAADDAFTRQTVLQLLVTAPILVGSAMFVTVAREQSDAREEAYRRLSERDALTGVGNYRALHNRIDYEVIRHARHQRAFSAIVLDLDDFKGVNDRHGHAEGDRLLRRVAEELTRTVRGEDTVARQGGDEFSVLAPETAGGQAAVLAVRIEERLTGIEVVGERVGVTLGWASFPADGTTPDDILAKADRSLRERKAARRLALR
jgi:diguanylate cyclase (GGDEF)-like protein